MPDYTTTIGNVEILALSDGSIRFAPTDFFPSIPKEAWEPYSADLTPDGEMVMNLGCFLLRSEGKTVLIDTGLGLDSGHLDTLEMGRLLTDMQEKGISRDDVDVVGITHLHIDHVGWNFMYDDDGEQDSEVERSGAAQATFANARYWVNNLDWRVFTRGALRRRPYISAQVLPLQEQGILELFEGERQITSEISTLPTPGHTPGHTSFLISSQGERAVITGDAIHARAQAQETHWSPQADSKPDISAESRRILLERIESESAMLISGHFPAPGFGTLVRVEGKRYWQAM
ncbi:MAG: MBL fold metallo-hydrolase [Chloroflexi bacterium]|nr:MBL fold metallo-hydrolase [Chloroflexota bacterium]